MRATDVTATLELALDASGCDRPTVLHRPRLLSGRRRSAIGLSDDGDGSSYIAGDLAIWLEGNRREHVRGAPNHPQVRREAATGPRAVADGQDRALAPDLEERSSGKRSAGSFPSLLTLLENHYLPGALETAVGDFVDHYNHRRVHESRGNGTPADAYFGRAPAILEARRGIKQATIRQRRLLNQKPAAQPQPDRARPSTASWPPKPRNI